MCHAALEELGRFEIKENLLKGRARLKAVKVLREVSAVITSGAALAGGKGKLPGVGKSTGIPYSMLFRID